VGHALRDMAVAKVEAGLLLPSSSSESSSMYTAKTPGISEIFETKLPWLSYLTSQRNQEGDEANDPNEPTSDPQDMKGVSSDFLEILPDSTDQTKIEECLTGPLAQDQPEDIGEGLSDDALNTFMSLSFLEEDSDDSSLDPLPVSWGGKEEYMSDGSER
jgi:hypothetical protein